MICTKCGSKMRKVPHQNLYRCTSKECRQGTLNYHTRLNKVLEKFEDGEMPLGDGDFLIYYIDNKFRLNHIDYIISLDTVENLIKDLEETQ